MHLWAVYVLSSIFLVRVVDGSTSTSTIQSLENFWEATEGNNWDYVALQARLNATTEYKDAFSGPQWNFTKVYIKKELFYYNDPCYPEHWVGINCENLNSTMHISKLVLPGALSGTLPNTISSLSYLTYIDLSHNNMTSTIPKMLRNLKLLQYIDLSMNHLVGPIDGLFKSSTLSKLEYINFSNNKLTGSLPDISSIADTNVLAIKVLNLSRNMLTGTLTETIKNMKNCEIFDLSSNKFHGMLPASLNFLTKLTNLDVSSNLLNGTIKKWPNLGSLKIVNLSKNKLNDIQSSNFTGISNVTDLDLSYNELSGELNDNLASMTSLRTLDLGYNQLSGTIPSSLADIKGLLSLYLNNNYYTVVDDSIATFTSLQLIDFSENKLMGSLPNWATLTNLREQYMRGNMLNGTIADYALLPSLVVLDLNSNQLQGSLPLVIITRDNLRTLDLGSNNLGDNGKESSEFIELSPNLVTFNLSANGFQGKLPIHIASIATLEDIDLSRNAYTGYLPDWSKLKKLSRMSLKHNKFKDELYLHKFSDSIQAIDLSFNDLYGVVPHEIKIMSNLTLLDLSHNNFHGTIPYDIKSLTNLFSLSMASNLFTGTIPEDIAEMTSLQLIDMSSNNFVGTLPPLNKLSKLYLLTVQHNQLISPMNGNFENGFLDSPKPDLTVLDVSNNEFTGQINPKLFQQPSLNMVNLGSNCFNGFLPNTLCSASNLELLILSKLTGSNNCKQDYWSNTFLEGVFDGFTDKNRMDGSIPACIFDLPKIKSIFIAGNTLDGTLNTNIGPNLKTIEASQNRLIGSIPDAYFHPSITTLDLAYNWLNGNLNHANSHIYNNNENIIKLNVNRLSGAIPSSYANIKDIDLVSGNVFECDSSSEIPINDPFKDGYMCAFSSFNADLYLFTVIFVILVSLLGYMYYLYAYARDERIHKVYKEVKLWFNMAEFEDIDKSDCDAAVMLRNLKSINDNENIKYDHIQRMISIIQRIRNLFIYVGGSLFSVFMVLYLILGGPKDRKLSNTYAFITTGGYLKGRGATVACMFFYTLAILSVRDVLVYDEIKRKRIKHRLEDEELLRTYRTWNMLNEETEYNRSSTDLRSSSEQKTLQDVASGDSPLNESDQKDLNNTSSEVNSVASASPPAKDAPSPIEKVSAEQDKIPRNSNDEEIYGRYTATPSPTVAIESGHNESSFYIFQDFIAPFLRVLAIILLSIGINATVNALYVFLHVNSVIEVKTFASMCLSVFMAIYPAYVVIPMFQSTWLMFGGDKKHHDKFINYLGGEISIRFFVNTFNSILIPMVMTSALDPSCFRGVFHSSEVSTISFKQWACEKFDQNSNFCADIRKTIRVEYVQDPFIYNFTCTSSLLSTYIPVYLTSYIGKFCMSLLKLVSLLYYGINHISTQKEVEEEVLNEIFHLHDDINSTVITPTEEITVKVVNKDAAVSDTGEEDTQITVAVLDTDNKRNHTTPPADVTAAPFSLDYFSYLSKLYVSRSIMEPFEVRRKKHNDNESEISVDDNNNTKIKLNGTEIIEHYLLHFVILASFSVLAPMLSMIIIAALALDTIVDQLTIGRFMVIEVNTILLAEGVPLNSIQPFSEPAKKSDLNYKKSRANGNAKSLAVQYTDDMIESIHEPYGSISALCDANDCCSDVDENYLSNIKYTYVMIASIVSAFVVNDMYNSSLPQTSYLAGGCMLLVIPFGELIVLFIKCCKPEILAISYDVTELEKEEHKMMQRSQSANRALRNVTSKQVKSSKNIDSPSPIDGQHATFISPFQMIRQRSSSNAAEPKGSPQINVHTSLRSIATAVIKNRERSSSLNDPRLSPSPVAGSPQVTSTFLKQNLNDNNVYNEDEIKKVLELETQETSPTADDTIVIEDKTTSPTTSAEDTKTPTSKAEDNEKVNTDGITASNTESDPVSAQASDAILLASNNVETVSTTELTPSPKKRKSIVNKIRKSLGLKSAQEVLPSPVKDDKSIDDIPVQLSTTAPSDEGQEAAVNSNDTTGEVKKIEIMQTEKPQDAPQFNEL